MTLSEGMGETNIVAPILLVRIKSDLKSERVNPLLGCRHPFFHNVVPSEVLVGQVGSTPKR